MQGSLFIGSVKEVRIYEITLQWSRIYEITLQWCSRIYLFVLIHIFLVWFRVTFPKLYFNMTYISEILNQIYYYKEKFFKIILLDFLNHNHLAAKVSHDPNQTNQERACILTFKPKSFSCQCHFHGKVSHLLKQHTLTN